MKLDPYLKPYTKNNLKYIKDLNVRAKAIKLWQENIKINLRDLEFGKGFLDMTPKTHEKKGKIDKSNYIKM